MRLAFASALLLQAVKLQIALVVFMTLAGCSRIPSPEGLQGIQSLEELTHLGKEIENANAEYANEDYALDALAIPHIKDPRIKERVSQMHWCGTPEWEYLLSNARPSENVLIARAAKMEVAWGSTPK